MPKYDDPDFETVSYAINLGRMEMHPGLTNDDVDKTEAALASIKKKLDQAEQQNQRCEQASGILTKSMMAFRPLLSAVGNLRRFGGPSACPNPLDVVMKGQLCMQDATELDAALQGIYDTLLELDNVTELAALSPKTTEVMLQDMTVAQNKAAFETIKQGLELRALYRFFHIGTCGFSCAHNRTKNEFIADLDCPIHGKLAIKEE